MEPCCRPAPLFTFGVIADIQYADMEDGFNYSRTRRRFYRSSLQLLRQAQDSWAASARRPRFILQLGDIIDGFNSGRGASNSALDTVLREFSSGPLQTQVHHVWGNHEFYNFTRSSLLSSRLNSSPGTEPGSDTEEPAEEPAEGPSGSRAGGDIYAYSFRPMAGFCFVVLDAYDVSPLGRDKSSDQYREAMELIRQYNNNEDLNCPPDADGLLQRFTMFNGGFSKLQLDWLDAVLTSADEKQEKVTIVSHLPVHPLSTSPICLAWNFDELLGLIRCHRSVVCFMAGHDHDGGYHQDKDTGVHHLTVEGVIETPPDDNAFATVSVYEDRMELKGSGRVADRVFLFPERQSRADQTAK